MNDSILNFLEKSPSFYFIKLSLTKVYTYVNELYGSHYAKCHKNFVGESIWNCIYEKDRDLFETAIEDCLKNTDKVFEVTYRKDIPAQQFAFVKFNFFAIRNEEGKVVEIGGIGYDVTEQTEQRRNIRKVQRSLQAVLNSSEEAFYFLDKELKVISFNNGARNAAKVFLNLEMHEGFDFKQTLLPGTEGDFMGQFTTALHGLASEIENEMSFPNGKNVWYKLSMKPVHDEKNRLIGVAVSYINIDLLKKSEKSLREIAWHQSHLVRKPLTNILGLVNILKEEHNKKETELILKMLEESALELDEVVKQVVSKTSV